MTGGNDAESSIGVTPNAAFVGRCREVDLLRRYAEEVRAGQSRTVIITGEPGVGKTALLQHIADRLDGFVRLQASCDPAEHALRFGVLTQFAVRLPPGTMNEILRITGQSGAVGSGPVGLELSGVLRRLQQTGPIVLLIDDLPWADNGSLEALGAAIRRLHPGRLLIIATVTGPAIHGEPDEIGVAWRSLLRAGGSAGHLHLSGLDEQGTRELAASYGVAGMTPHAVRRLTRHTGGHPRYLRGILVETQAELLAWGRAPLPVPRSLLMSIRHQLGSLRPESVRLLETLAVFGRPCPLAVAAVVGAVADAPAALESVLRTGLGDWWPEEPSTPVAIRYPLQRDAIYRAIPPSRRQELHARAASYVDTEAAWAHRVAATAHVDTVLADDLEAAAELLAVNRPQRAATLLRWAADLSEHRADRERRVLAAAGHLLATGRRRPAEALLPEVRSCRPSPWRSCLLGMYAVNHAQFDSAQALLAEAVQQADAVPGGTAVRMMAGLQLAGLYAWMGRGHDVRRAAWAVLDIPDLAGHHALSAATLLAMGVLQTEGPQVALTLLADMAQLPSAPNQVPPSQSFALVFRGVIRFGCADLVGAVSDLRVGLSYAEDSAVAEADVHAHIFLAWSQYLLGEWDEAVMHAEQAATIAIADHDLWAVPEAFALAAFVPAARGEWDRADERIRQARTWRDRVGPPGSQLHPALATAVLHQARGDGAGMLAALQPVVEHVTQDGPGGWALAFQLWWRPLYIQALLANGQLAAAGHELDLLTTDLVGVPCLRPVLGWLSGWLAELQGDHGSAREWYANALGAPEPPGDLPLYRAFLEQACGRLLLTMKDEPGGMTWLRRARQRFLDIGAVSFAQRCGVADGAADLPVPRAVGAEIATLTERERAVVRLAAEGRTNVEIARTLYVTTKTIEYHLTNAYNKLGITSRRQLRSVRALTGV